MKRLAIRKCPHGTYSICIDDEDGSGTRLTPSKHCGRWDMVADWPLTPALAEQIVTELQCQAGDK